MPSLPETQRIPYYVQDPKIIPIGEWLPDQPALNNPGCTIAVNVVARSPTSYSPMAGLASVGYAALPALTYGAITFFDAAGQVHIFAGTQTKLYRLHTGDSAFVDVTKIAATYSAASPNNIWFFTSMGQTIIATDGVDVPQKFAIGDANFSDLSATAPIGKYVATVRNFLMFGNTTESATNFPQRVHWSAIGDPTSYPALGSNAAAQVQSDAQDLRSDLGWVRGLASGLLSADVAIFMDKGVYAARYVGSPEIFSFQVAQGVMGCRAPYSIVPHKGLAYYLSTDGWKAFDGVSMKEIGAQKIDRYFFNDPNDAVDQQFIGNTQGAASLTGKHIFWIYCGPNSGGLPNRMLIYEHVIDRWSIARYPAGINFVLQGMGLGYTLEQLDAFGNLETITPNLDSSYWQGGGLMFLAFDGIHTLSSFTGPNLAAQIETTEIQPSPGYRSRVTSTRPIVDGGTNAISIALGTRVNMQDAVTYGSDVAINTFGDCPQRVDARYFRARVTIPAGLTWQHIQGVQMDFTKSTKR